ncbi:hypothetical protein SSX86_026829 [Deinandra increscens subsp. villosa]|uniref:very-long-chain 3-oxoacyl-CoA synthase n=1 Tax=Deinandra increscens subsp. villosa TaxID=3103831 RepID=A0AAP0CF77_9ASTR
MFLALLIICLLFLSFKFIITKKASCKVYLIDFACYKPPPYLKCSRHQLIKQARESGYFSENLLDLMKRILERSGLGDSTYLTEVFFKLIYDPSMEDARKEVEMAVFGSLDMLLAKTGVKCQDIGILIVNCCIYSTEPSLSCKIVNRYKFRENIITYNLTGMGCSAGLQAIGLAKQLLQVNRNTYALIVSTESLTENFYNGKDRSKFLINCLFRTGGAAILLSNRRSDHNNSKYQLLHAVHTNTSSSDRSYNCILREEDNAGKLGITVTKDLLAAAIATIKPNITDLGYKILPIKEKLLYLINRIARTLLPSQNIKALCFLMNKKTSCKVYLIDFVCYKPPDSQKCSRERFLKQIRQHGHFTEEILDFLKNLFERGGLGDSTYLSETYFKQSYKPSMKEARREVEMTIFGSLDKLLRKTGVRTDNIGILIVNCCVYNTEPSLSSMIVNRYKFSENIITYNLAGMGCSAGLLATGLAKQLLQVHHNSYALIVSTESITQNFYVGKDRSKILINSLFRVGGVAILLSNRPNDHNKSKYELLHAIHNNTSNSDRFYNCIIHEEDSVGIGGVNINRDLLAAAIATIRPNLITLGHLILPIREKLSYQITYIIRKLLPSMKFRQYVPNYGNAVDHFLPHVGGKAVLDDLQKTLRVSDEVMEASRMTLYRYGNTSSSSIWYELAYVESKGRVKEGKTVWQLSFGSGFKCSSVIWRAMKAVDHDVDNPWTDEIDGFPVIVDCGSIPVEFAPSSKSSNISSF